MRIKVRATINGACSQTREFEVPNEYPWNSCACNTPEQIAMIQMMHPNWSEICIDARWR